MPPVTGLSQVCSSQGPTCAASWATSCLRPGNVLFLSGNLLLCMLSGFLCILQPQGKSRLPRGPPSLARPWPRLAYVSRGVCSAWVLCVDPGGFSASPSVSALTVEGASERGRVTSEWLDLPPAPGPPVQPPRPPSICPDRQLGSLSPAAEPLNPPHVTCQMENPRRHPGNEPPAASPLMMNLLLQQPAMPAYFIIGEMKSPCFPRCPGVTHF